MNVFKSLLRHGAPSRAVHPGAVLRDELAALKMSGRALATALRLPPNRIAAILHEKRGITPNTALRLERFFAGTSAEFWLNMQRNHDLITLRPRMAAALRKIVPRPSKGTK